MYKNFVFLISFVFFCRINKVSEIMKSYIPQLDYLKSIFIILMILFHLVYIGDTYPYLKQVVYTFHMPIFLILSGYLSGTDKDMKAFFYSFWWLFVPYAIMETGYIVAASVLPVREQIGGLEISNILKRIFVDPVGPYWYLHTLLLCRTVHYIMSRLIGKRLDNMALLIFLGFCFWGLSMGLNLMSFAYSMYFLIGVGIRKYNLDFLSLFSPSMWSIVPVVVFCCYPCNLMQFNLAGCAIVYFIVSFFLWMYSLLPQRMIGISMIIGKNTLCLLLFSPIFTMLSRMYQPLFMFEPSGICFALFTIILAIIGCLAITWCMDKLKISPWFFGQNKMLKN